MLISVVLVSDDCSRAVIRYLDRVVVLEDGYEVAFKAGMTVEAEI